MTHSEASAGMAAWQVEALRLTAFLPPTTTLATESWWSELTGQPPAQQISRPREGQSQTDGSLVRPDLPRTRLILKTQTGRVDWLLRPELETEEGLADIELMHLGPFEDVLPIFSEMMRDWLLAADLDITRVALGVTLRLPAESKQAAYSLISKYVPCPLATDSSDFLYRINRPRPNTSLGDDTVINRLATWAVIHVVALRIAVSDGLTPQGPIRRGFGSSP